MGQSLAEEADRCLAKMSSKNEDRKTSVSRGAGERCITNKDRYRSRSPRDDNKLAFNNHLSIADELDQLSDEDTAPTDLIVNASDNTTGTAYEGEEALENVDLDTFETHEDSIAADFVRAGAAYTAYKPKIPSKLAKQLGESCQEDDKSDAIYGRHASQARSQGSVFESSDARSGSNNDSIEEERPRRSRMEIWPDETQEAETLPNEYIYEEPEFGSSEHKAAPTAISVADEDSSSSIDAVHEERDSGLTKVQRRSHETSPSTRVTTNEDGSGPKCSFDQDWSPRVDFDKNIDLQSLSPWTRVHSENDITNVKALPPLPPTPSSMQSAALEGKELDDFIRVSIFAVNAIRSNKDKHTVSKTRDIQHLVEKVLVDEVCGRRTSYGDMLDRSAWRP